MSHEQPPPSRVDGASIETRASALYAESYKRLAARNDRIFQRLLACEWIAGMLLAVWITPRAYVGAQSSIHVHVYAAIFLGLATISLPLFLIRYTPGTAATRHAIAAGQMIISGLLIDLTGGRLETHFLIFGSLAFLAFYRDWRILVTASTITAVDHFLRGILLPRSIYGVDIVSAWRWAEHGAYVVFENLFLIPSCLFGVRERWLMSMRQAELESTQAELLRAHEGLERRVEERTADVCRIAEDRAQIADRLAESERFARSTVDALSAHIAILDESGLILAVNKAWESFATANFKTHGFHAVGANYFEVCDRAGGEAKDDAIAMACGIRAVLGGLQAQFSLEYPCHAPHERRWFVGRVTRFPGEGPVRVVVAHENITTRKIAEEQLKAARDTAEIATRTKSEFLANMSHEIRTPVTAMVGFADIMLDPEQTQSDRVDGLQTIRRNAKHLLDLINEILDLSKIEAGRMTVESIATELPPLLSDVMSMMRPRALEKGLELKLRFSDNVPRRVVTDPVRVKQILMNLVSNALKFTERGHVEVAVSSDASAKALNFAITDTGIGISHDQLSRLFQAFTQADGSTTRRFGGTGLGLTISKHLAQLLGGDITVRSVVGIGSTFTAHIAGAGDGSGEFCRLEDALVVPRAGPEAVFEIISGKVLLAEDGIDNQRFISAMLRKAGVEVVIAENGRIAVDKALGGTFDLVLMDMQMPVLDGYAASSRLRGRGFSKPIIALTAHAMADDRAKCIQAGCSDYLSKPIDRSLLIQTVGRYLKQAVSIKEAIPPKSAQAGSTSNEIISTCDGDPVMEEVLAEFVAHLPAEVESLQALLDHQNLSGLQDAMHQLKGAGGCYGFQCISDAAAIAESSLKSAAPLETIELQVQDLVDLIRNIRGFQPTLAVLK